MDLEDFAQTRHKVLIHDGEKWRQGYTERSDWESPWTMDRKESPEILFVGEDCLRKLQLSDLQRVRFVASFDPDSRGELHFFDGTPPAKKLWVRLRLRDDEWREGYMTNSAQVFTGALLALRPSDPESSEMLLLFQLSQIEGFEVLGLRT